jgi:RNA polymerase sigma-70 factor, ECF subfamily
MWPRGETASSVMATNAVYPPSAIAAHGRTGDARPAVCDSDELVFRCQRGDQTACDALLQGLRRQIYAIVHTTGRDGEWVEDTVVEIMVHLYRSIGSFRNESSFRTWAYSVATKVCAAELRRAGRLKNNVLAPVIGQVGWNDPADLVAARDQQQRILQAMAALPEKYRTAVALRYIGDCSYRELADILRVPVGTAKTLVFQGVRRIRQVFGETLREEELR